MTIIMASRNREANRRNEEQYRRNDYPQYQQEGPRAYEHRQSSYDQGRRDEQDRMRRLDDRGPYEERYRRDEYPRYQQEGSSRAYERGQSIHHDYRRPDGQECMRQINERETTRFYSREHEERSPYKCCGIYFVKCLV